MKNFLYTNSKEYPVIRTIAFLMLINTGLIIIIEDYVKLIVSG